MAETSYIIQNGRRLNLKDTTARKSIGSCDELQTETKHCLVMAINELNEKVKNGGGGGGGGGGDYVPTSRKINGKALNKDIELDAADVGAPTVDEMNAAIEEAVGASGGSGGGVDLSAVYPVGSIYLSVLDTDPATLFGFGTWERIKDKFLLSAGDTYAAGSEGGEAEHTLSEAEMPKHLHYYNSYQHGYPTSHTGDSSYMTPVVSIGASHDGNGVANTHSNYAGGSQPHNNMPPYLTVYMWQRTA